MPPPSVNKAVPSGFETQRRHHQKSKAGVSVQWPHKKDICAPKNFKQNVFSVDPYPVDSSSPLHGGS